MKNLIIIAPRGGLLRAFGDEHRQEYDIRFADGAKEAFRLHREKRADLVLLDLDLPGEDPVATVMEFCPGVPVFAFARGVDAALRCRKAEAAGAKRTFEKPVTHRDLSMAVASELLGKGEETR